MIRNVINIEINKYILYKKKFIYTYLILLLNLAMSQYQKESIKKFITSTIINNQLIPDCLEIIFNKIKNNILLSYATFDDAIISKASYFELTILEKCNIYEHHIYDCIINNYKDGVLYMLDNNILSNEYIYKHFILLLIFCCENSTLEIFKLIYNTYNNYLPTNYNWVHNCVFPIIRKKNIDILQWFKDEGLVLTLYNKDIEYALYMNDYNLIQNAYDLNINIICDNPIDYLYRSIEKQHFEIMNV